jgi:ATP-binding cassette subfamily B protein
MMLMMRRVPKVRQHDMSDCGVACLASIARHHRQRVPIARLRQYAHTDKSGTSMLGLARAAQQLGYSAKSVRATPESLARVPMPTVAHVTLTTGAHHFVVVERADEHRVWLMDPDGGERRTEPRADFDARWSGVLLLLTPGAQGMVAAAVISRVERVWQLGRPHRGALTQALLGALVYTLLGLSTSIYVQTLVDSVLADGRIGPLHVMTGAMLAIALAQTVIGGLRSALMVNVGQHIDATLVLGYYGHLLKLPQSFFDRMRVGELTSRVTDAVKIRAFVGEVIVEAAANVFVVAASAAMMFSYDWRLAVWTLGMFPLYAGLYALGSRLNRRQQRTLMERAAALESQIVESLSAIGTVKRFGLEKHSSLMTEARFVRLFRSVGTAARTSIWIGNAGLLVSRIGMIGLLWLGASRALAQELSAGQLMSCYALLGFLTGPALSLVGFSRAVQEARVASERLFEIMDIEPETRLSPTPLVREDTGDVRFERVSFRYGDREAALTDISFTCARGSVTALVGESGSGKSTLAALVQRLYTVDKGRILIGSRDLANTELTSLRRLVGVVPQTIDLFSGSIIENLALGDPAPNIPRVMELCAEVGLRETIERMPQGWLTSVGERGVALSGGERQRVAIVRALYREPAVLILDEATSALDSANEQLVRNVMHRAANRGTTVIVIAHRLTTIAAADHIVVLAKGRVVEEGDHEALVEAGGPYARLWSHQNPVERRALEAAV